MIFEQNESFTRVKFKHINVKRNNEIFEIQSRNWHHQVFHIKHLPEYKRKKVLSCSYNTIFYSFIFHIDDKNIIKYPVTLSKILLFFMITIFPGSDTRVAQVLRFPSFWVKLIAFPSNPLICDVVGINTYAIKIVENKSHSTNVIKIKKKENV